MLQDVLSRLEERCAREAPGLLDEVRAARTLADSAFPSAPTLGGALTLHDDGAPEATAPAPAVDGAGRYVDLGAIGEGGMGEVRRVRDRELNRVVALKRVRADIVASTSAVARFVEEVQITAQLQHPGIVPVYDAGRLPDGRVYFTMQEVRGRTLSAVIGSVHLALAEGWATPAAGRTFRKLVSALHQASQAVGYAHDRGVVHRDLKPDNVMLGAHGEVQVMDWGLCKLVGRADVADEGVVVERTRAATMMGGVMGTPEYMAPEQARGELDAIDPRSDVYALGAMLYEILTGRPPYTGASSTEVLERVLSGPPEPLTRGSRRASSIATAPTAWDGPSPAAPFSLEGLPAPAGADLPEELVATCLKAMSRDPAHRHPTAAAFAEELEAWLDGSKARERALEVVARAEEAPPEVASLRERAAALPTSPRPTPPWPGTSSPATPPPRPRAPPPPWPARTSCSERTSTACPPTTPPGGAAPPICAGRAP